MEKLIANLSALGVPGLVLVIAVHASGLAGGAAIVAALAALGPGGMIGGIITLGLLGLLAHELAEHGVDAIFSAVLKSLLEKGESKESILRKVNKYPISQKLKCKLRDQLFKA